MRNNYLFIGTVTAIVLYWLLGIFIPQPYLSSTSSFALLFFGAAVFLRYAPVAWEVLFNNKRMEGEGQDGSHLAVLGTAMLAAGSVYVGIFGLAWVLSGQPSHWLGTPISGFGRALMAGGFWLMYASPEVVRRDIRVPGLTWLIVIISASVLTGLVLGYQLELK